MTKLFIATAFACSFLYSEQSIAASNAPDTTAVPLFSNAYVYPSRDAGNGEIGRGGLRAWKSKEGYTKTFFLVNQPGPLALSLKLKPGSAASKLSVQLGNEKKALNVPAGSASITLPVGEYNVTAKGYHAVEIHALEGSSLPMIEDVLFSGPNAESIQYNASRYRGAPATHLSYPVPPNSGDVEWFYNEINVPADAQPLHSYYMVNGFSGGYFGIQINSKTERRVLFSIWSAYDTQDPKQIPEEYAVKLVRKGKDVTINEFGNEGSGGQSFWKFNWKAETTYKLLVHAKPNGDHTVYSGYFFDPAVGKWKLIATWDKAKSGGKYLGGLYSFVENFSDNGEDFFKARYGNQWVRTAKGEWIELTKARFSTTANPKVHQRFDVGGGLEKGMFYMFSGGFREVGNQYKGSMIERPATKVPPAIDLEHLPKQ